MFLKQKRLVVVTGGLGGIGEAVYRKFEESGDFVVSIDLARCPDRRRPFFNCDVVNKIEVLKTCRDIFEKYGPMAVLVNAAGVLPSPLPFIKTTGEIVDKIMDTNFFGTLIFCQAVLPYMRKRGYGRIVNISSIAAQRGDAGNAIYAASKAAVENLTKSLALEAPFNKDGKPFDITVNAVAPGIVETQMTKDLPEKSLKEYMKRNPLKRKIAPEEVANAVYFLATASNAFNGIILPVDGGYSAS